MKECVFFQFTLNYCLRFSRLGQESFPLFLYRGAWDGDSQLSWVIKNSQIRGTKQVNELGFKPSQCFLSLTKSANEVSIKLILFAQQSKG